MGSPGALPFRSDAASASQTERRMASPGAAAGWRVPCLGSHQSAVSRACSCARSRLSRLDSRAFKELSARPPRPPPPPASPRDEPRPRPPPQPAARGTAARGTSRRCAPPASVSREPSLRTVHQTTPGDARGRLGRPLFPLRSLWLSDRSCSGTKPLGERRHYFGVQSSSTLVAG